MGLFAFILLIFMRRLFRQRLGNQTVSYENLRSLNSGEEIDCEKEVRMNGVWHWINFIQIGKYRPTIHFEGKEYIHSVFGVLCSSLLLVVFGVACIQAMLIFLNEGIIEGFQIQNDGAYSLNSFNTFNDYISKLNLTLEIAFDTTFDSLLC